MSIKQPILFVWALAVIVCQSALAVPEPPIYNSAATAHPEAGLHGIVSSREKLASEAGLAALQNGGNAVDAAVTVGFALAVTAPQAGNIGGGGFVLIHLADTGETVAIDYREKAPLAAQRDMFLDENGEVNEELSRYSHRAVGVPGTVAGLAMALEKYGTISLAEAIAPAIELAEKGFPVNEDLYTSLKTGKSRIQKHAPHAVPLFFDDAGNARQPGEIIKLPDLARSLKIIAKDGPNAFYKGPIADLLVKDMQDHRGLITHADLASYHPVERSPVRGTYKGYEILSMPPPSSGGAHIVQILNIVEPLDLKSHGHNSAQTIHLMAEAMKYAYADRSKHLGDSDFNPVPLEWLTSKEYANRIRSKMNFEQATPSADIMPGKPPAEGSDTTHFSVIDRYGNAVSNTYTVNFSFGSKIMPPGAGFFLNNEMDDFSSKPGVPNAYGLIGGEFNSIEAEKRMLSSMSPTIVLKDGKPFLLTGSRGGSRIITVTLQVILNVIEHEMNIAEAVAAPRIHHQWLPDVLRLERGISPDTIRLLEDMGYKVEVGSAMGSAHSLMRQEGVTLGAADPRRPDSHAVGY